MKLTLVRDFFTDTTTIGRLSINGVFFCDVLEDTDRKLESGGVKVYGKTCIPRGTYEIIIDMSSRFKQLMPRLLNVHQFEGVRIHPGNTSEDTEGCLLPGVRSCKSGTVVNSRVTYNRLLCQIEEALGKGQTVTIDIR